MHSSLTLTFWDYTQVYVPSVHRMCTGKQGVISLAIKELKGATYHYGK